MSYEDIRTYGKTVIVRVRMDQIVVRWSENVEKKMCESDVMSE